jgi:hypothetical protein
MYYFKHAPVTSRQSQVGQHLHMGQNGINSADCDNNSSFLSVGRDKELHPWDSARFPVQNTPDGQNRTREHTGRTEQDTPDGQNRTHRTDRTGQTGRTEQNTPDGHNRTDRTDTTGQTDLLQRTSYPTTTRKGSNFERRCLKRVHSLTPRAIPVTNCSQSLVYSCDSVRTVSWTGIREQPIRVMSPNRTPTRTRVVYDKDNATILQ